MRHTDANAPNEAALAGDPLLGEIVERLRAELNPARIYLFGWRARGEARPDSDYDLLVLVENPSEPLYPLAQGGFRALRGSPAAVDVVVWDRATFDARRHLTASFRATVCARGGCFMPHDPARVAECTGWLERVWADLD